MDSILFEKRDAVALIKLNRPEVFNSFNREMALNLQEALKLCAGDAEVRAVLLTGTGKAFCAGQDLNEVSGPEALGFTTILEEHYNPIVRGIRELEKPVVAAVNGVAAGAGANIALACDLVVATESASFIQAFSKIGLVPDSGGTYFLPRLIGLPRAAALMMLGEKVSAAEAVAMGMIYRSYPDATFGQESLALVQRLAQMPTRGLALTKKALNYALANDLDRQLAIEVELQNTAGGTFDYQEGVQAFLEKRKPVFKGN